MLMSSCVTYNYLGTGSCVTYDYLGTLSRVTYCYLGTGNTTYSSDVLDLKVFGIFFPLVEFISSALNK